MTCPSQGLSCTCTCTRMYPLIVSVGVITKDPPCVKGVSIDGNCKRDPLNRRKQGSGWLGQLGGWTLSEGEVRVVEWVEKFFHSSRNFSLTLLCTSGSASMADNRTTGMSIVCVSRDSDVLSWRRLAIRQDGCGVKHEQTRLTCPCPCMHEQPSE